MKKMGWLISIIVFLFAIYLLSKIPFLRRTMLNLKDQFLAARLQRHTKSVLTLQPQIVARTTELFKSMEEVINKVGGPILDIGCGNGCNVPYYPSNVRLCTLDLNEHFKPYLMENLNKTKIELENYGLGDAEDMSNVYPDNSFSCVVSSKLLCCVDQEKTLREIMRVLKPGGRLYFIEHIVELPGTFTHAFQILFTPIWKRLVFNCQADKKTDKVLKDFGFENLQLEIWNRPLPIRYFWARRTCIGYGDKPHC